MGATSYEETTENMAKCSGIAGLRVTLQRLTTSDLQRLTTSEPSFGHLHLLGDTVRVCSLVTSTKATPA